MTPLHDQLRSCQMAWDSLGDSFAATLVRDGLRLQWYAGRPGARLLTSQPSPETREATELVTSLLLTGAIAPCAEEELWGISAIITVPKKDGGWRPALNLKPVNAYLRTDYFTLPTLKTIIPFVHQGWWATSVDLSSAYFHLAMHSEAQPWLGMCYKNQCYRWVAMPFGLATAPREWQRLMRPVVQRMRSEGYLCWVYLDDFLILAPTRIRAAAGTAKLISLLRELGLTVNIAKSNVEPAQRIVYLGFLINLYDGLIQIPMGKVEGVCAAIDRLLKAEVPAVRRVASVVGKLRALAYAVPHVRLLTNLLQAHVERISRRGWGERRALPVDAVRQLQEAKDHLRQWRGHPLFVNPSTYSVYADVPHLAWGAVLTRSEQGGRPCAPVPTPSPPTQITGVRRTTKSLFVNEKSINGWFQHPTSTHINAKEFQATIKAIEAFILTDQHLDVYTDNTTVYHYIRKWGGRLPHYQQLVRRLWDLLQERKVTISIHWVASEFNPADLPSRERWSLSRAALHESTVEWIMQGFPHISCTVDWMACCDTAQCPRYIAEGPQPKVRGVTLVAEDLFTQGDNLQRFSPGWCNPPWHLIPQVLRLIAHSPGAKTLLVCPDLPGKPWWPLFNSMAVGRRRRVPRQQVLLVDPEGNLVEGRASLICAVVCSTATVSEGPPGKRRKL